MKSVLGPRRLGAGSPAQRAPAPARVFTTETQRRREDHAPRKLLSLRPQSSCGLGARGPRATRRPLCLCVSVVNHTGPARRTKPRARGPRIVSR